MSTPKSSFKGQLSDEQVLFFFRMHWTKVLPSLLFVILFLLIIAAIIVGAKPLYSLGYSVHDLKWIILTLLTLLTGVVHYEFIKIFYYHLHTVVVTNMRLVIVDKSIYFRDSRESIDLSKIQDVNKKQNGLFPTIFNYGELIITLAGSDTLVTVDHVPTPDHYFKRINKVKQEMGSLTSG